MPEAGRRSHADKALRLLAVCVVTGVLAYICLIVPRGAERVSPIWLPNAFVLAALLTSRRSAWPLVALMGSFGNVIANLAVGDSVALALSISACNTTEYVVGALTISRLIGPVPDMARPKTLALYAATTATVSVAAATAATLVLGGFSRPYGFSNFVIWAMADFGGLLLVTPCLLALAGERADLRRLVATNASSLSFLLVVTLGVFLQTRYSILYFIPAAMLLVIPRLRVAGVALALLGMLGIAVICTIYGRGPLALVDGPIDEQVLLLQLFLAVCFYTSLPSATRVTREHELQDRVKTALAETEEEARKVRMAQSVARLGYWRLDLRTGEIGWSDEMFRLLGMSPGDELSREIILARVHPDDRDAWEARFNRALLDGEPYEQDILRMLTIDGELRYARARVVLEHDAEGRAVGVFGVLSR